jgi:hypothetical protein
METKPDRPGHDWIRQPIGGLFARPGGVWRVPTDLRLEFFFERSK